MRDNMVCRTQMGSTKFEVQSRVNQHTELPAKKILGQHFFGSREYAHFFPELTVDLQPDTLAPFPWSLDVLKSPCPFTPSQTIAETHIAFFAINTVEGQLLSIRKWLNVIPRLFRPGLFGSYSYMTDFACADSWYLMPLRPPSNAHACSYDAQLCSLPLSYTQSSAIEEVTRRIVISMLKLDKREAAARFSFCSDSLSRPREPFPLPHFQLAVSSWNACQIDIKYFSRQSHWWPRFGLATSRTYSEI